MMHSDSSDFEAAGKCTASHSSKAYKKTTIAIRDASMSEDIRQAG